MILLGIVSLYWCVEEYNSEWTSAYLTWSFFIGGIMGIIYGFSQFFYQEVIKKKTEKEEYLRNRFCHLINTQCKKTNKKFN